MLSFKEYRKSLLSEELLPKEERDAELMKENGRDYYVDQFIKSHPKAQEAFQNSNERDRHTIRFPIEYNETSGAPHEGVSGFLKDKGFTVTPDNYKRGIVTKTSEFVHPVTGLNTQKVTEHKIGRILEQSAPEDIKKAFVNDSFRTGGKTQQLEGVMSFHTKHVYGISTGRGNHPQDTKVSEGGWTSCAQMRRGQRGYGGPASLKMRHEINNNTAPIYIVPKGGNPDTDAVGRMLAKEHEGLITGHKTLMFEDNNYGSISPQAVEAIKAHVGSLFEKKPDEVYKKNPNVYNDDGNTFKFPTEKPTAAHLDLAWKSLGTKDDKDRTKLMTMVSPHEKYKSKGLNDVAKSLKNIHDANQSGDFNKVMDAVTHFDTNQNPDTHNEMNFHSEHLHNLLMAGAEHFDIKNPDHVQKLIDSMKGTGYGNYTRNAFKSRIMNRVGQATNVDEYHALEKLASNGISHSERNKVAISPNHTMGTHPFDAIIKSHADRGTLNGETYSRAFASVSGNGLETRSGNMYDHAVRHEAAGVPGMSNTITSLARTMSTINSSGFHTRKYTPDENMALSYHLMKPKTRERISSILGEDHREVMKNKKAINDHKNAMKEFGE
jgi:hypothetical protein